MRHLELLKCLAGRKKEKRKNAQQTSSDWQTNNFVYLLRTRRENNLNQQKEVRCFAVKWEIIKMFISLPGSKGIETESLRLRARGVGASLHSRAENSEQTRWEEIKRLAGDQRR